MARIELASDRHSIISLQDYFCFVLTYAVKTEQNPHKLAFRSFNLPANADQQA